MNDVVLSFSPSVFNTTQFKNSVASGRAVKVILTVLLDENYDTGKYLATSSGLRGDDFFCRSGFEITAEVYVSGTYAYDMTKLAAPMTITYNYTNEWNSSTTSRSENNIKMAWYDRERIAHSYGGWDVLSSSLNTSANIVSAQSSYLSGIYLPVVTENSTTNNGGISPGGSTNSDPQMPAYAAEYIKSLQRLGIVPTTMKDFSVSITRQEFVAFLVRAVNAGSEPGFVNPFRDVDSNNEYYTEILAGADSGLVSGRTDDTFDPTGKITRQEIATFMARALAFKQLSQDSSLSGLSQLSDAAQISAWAKNSCAIAYNAKLISGRSEGGVTKFMPLAETTRAEAIVMISRLMNLN